MKLLIAIAAVAGSLFFSGCADQSLLTDEEYAEMRKPAPNSPDPMQHLPYNPNVSTPR